GSEARQFLGSATVTTDSLGNATFDVGLAVVVPFGNQVTATATRLATGDTSALADSQPVSGAIITGIPPVVYEGTPITLSAFTAADPGGGNSLAYNWMVTKNGGPAAFATSSEAAITFPPDNQGAYAVTLQVTSSTGSTATVGPIVINALNASPAVEIDDVPSETNLGTAVHAHAIANDPGTADVLTYAWNAHPISPTGLPLT